jgi:hypothetical protein
MARNGCSEAVSGPFVKVRVKVPARKKFSDRTLTEHPAGVSGGHREIGFGSRAGIPCYRVTVGGPPSVQALREVSTTLWTMVSPSVDGGPGQPGEHFAGHVRMPPSGSTVVIYRRISSPNARRR